MPIRHCQKCGLKVLIDESQSTANPFFCQRCSASLKAPNQPAVAVADSPAPKGGPIKILCPYCKASFNGRLPSKPAKGKCPICRKDLVLLPNGQVRPAATFDLAKWQQESAGGPSPMPAPKATDETVVVDPDLQAAPVQPPEDSVGSALDAALGTSESNPLAGDSAVITSSEPLPSTEPPPPPPVESEPAPVPSEAPPEPPPPEPEPVKRPTSKLPTRPLRKLDAPASAAIPEATGSGKVFLAIMLFLLPLIGGGAGYALKDGALKTILEKVGGIGVRGFVKIHEKLKPPPPPPMEEEPKPAPKPVEQPKEEKPAVDPQQQKKDCDAIDTAYMEYRRLERSYHSQLVGATEAQKNSDEFKQIKAKVDELEKKYKDLREKFKKDWGSDHDPSKE